MRLSMPDKLTEQEDTCARAAFAAALVTDPIMMHVFAAKITPRGRVEVLACLEVLEQTLRVMVQRDVAASLLQPDSLPAGVEGIPCDGAEPRLATDLRQAVQRTGDADPLSFDTFYGDSIQR